MGGVPFSPNDVAHSAKYNGLVLYISRLVRSLWKRELVSKRFISLIYSLSPNGQELLVPTFTSEQLASIQLNLGSLEAFLKLYPKLTAAPTPDTRPTQGDHEAWKIEQQSFAYIHEIIIRTLETISFLSILIDFKIPNLVQNLSEHDRKELISITFDGLVILPKGREVAKALMSALINNQINKEIGAEYVIDSLQKRCPGICESNDVILFKGMENLRTAKSIANQGSSAQLLQDALKYDVIDCRLFLSISKHLTLEKLSEIVENFKQLRFYPGIIDLVLLKSSEYVIPDNLAVDVNNPYNEILDLRQRCYELIFGTFSSISNLGATGQMSKDQVEKYTKVLLNKALASDDRNFHYSLYTWFINQSWIDKLLEIQSPHFEAFLVEKKRDLVLADYLCRFYVRNNRFFDAAQLLSEIACYPGLNLDTRLSYLANAIANAKSCTGSNTQELLGQLNDLLDVARIQADIISTLKNIPDTELLLQELDSELLDLATVISN
ncbi:hypothetical protein HK103_002791 [Boothiomyces macroporosus]|uniref:Nucleoporin Nup133/Nup155-like C-terminal domain-containing protein n=1 Tax=Boothiomyces macroporosus TaxID=261099 RepID=A0AAD5Y6K4_9FUNG|nr:hypothetical protein HK103_002791 [Boothiomyces macroporosus]